MILNDFFWRLKIYFVIELINGKKLRNIWIRILFVEFCDSLKMVIYV